MIAFGSGIIFATLLFSLAGINLGNVVEIVDATRIGRANFSLGCTFIVYRLLYKQFFSK